MVLMLCGHSMVNYIPRRAFKLLIELIAKQHALSEGARAMLMSAWTPGYLLTQIPAGWVLSRFSAKHFVTLQVLASSALLLLLPAAAAMKGVRVGAISVVLFALGLVHGPLLPVQGALKARWCYGEPFALQLIRFGRTLSDFTLPLTGVLAARLGWPVVPCGIAVLGGLFSVVWHRLAAERPVEEPVARDDAEQACRTTGSGTGSEAGSEVFGGDHLQLV